jgi:hypothetical protein
LGSGRAPALRGQGEDPAGQRQGQKARWELYSNHTGEFAQRVPAGKADYVVWADLKGYKLASEAEN